jgi:hypothetical protein
LLSTNGGTSGGKPNRGPELERGSAYKRLGQLDDAQIIIQVRATATMVCAASDADARSAFAPLAGSSDVLTLRIQEKDVGAAVPALSAPLEPSACRGKALEVKVVGDGEQEV